MAEPRRGLRVEKVITVDPLELDVVASSNVWIIGDDHEVVIVDAAHDADAIIMAVAGRNVTAVVCTHGHRCHVSVAPEVAETLYAPILMHPADDRFWCQSNGDSRYWQLHDGNRIAFAGTEFRAIHTPGHSAGSTCLYVPDFGVLFGGDAMSDNGGPSSVDRPAVCAKVLTLPESTVVHLGHGESTSVGNILAGSQDLRAYAG